VSLTFYAALSVSPSSIRKTYAKFQNGYSSLDPLENIMFTPISEGEQAHQTIRDISQQYDIDIMFDSGGYEVQVGNKEFDDLYAYLIDFYNSNDWGARYVLPDNVPVSGDDEEVVDRKVDETISASRMCFRRMPDSLKENAVAVTQGHTTIQLSRCIEAYEQFDGLQHIGFGSFATSGVSNGVNMLTMDSFHNLDWAVDRAHDAGLSVHAFGVGGPTSIPLLAEAGVDSFDSTSWMRSGGYGNVFFPFKSRYNATHRTTRAGNLLRADDLPHLKAETGHECPFCETVSDLRDSRWNRILHNLIVIHEMAEQVEEMDTDEVLDAMDAQSTYRRRLEKIDNATRSLSD